MDQYLSQYQSKYQLRAGLKKEGTKLAREEGRVRDDRLGFLVD